MSGALKAKIIVVVVLLALTAALVGTCIAYRNRACEHTSLEHIEAVEPTCTESGNIEHWACKRCGATFKDESGAEEIGRVVRTALGHNLIRHSAVEPTCTEAGNVEYWECERCGVIFSDSAATKPLDDHIVAASGHDWNEPAWNWSDDYSRATAYFVCNKDSEHVESVTAKVTISSAPATCTGSGRITYLAKAELDGKTYSDSEVVQSGALGHDWTVSEWIWADDHTSVTAYFVCSRDLSHTHELTETEIVVNEDPATCLADGKTEYSVEITFDGNTYSDTAVVTLPATGHNWGEPEWTWSGDYSEAEATFTCQNDPSHTETLNAVVTRLSSSATCTDPGNTEYKAELSFNENVYTDSQSVSGEALGHNWDVSEWIWSKDHTSVTANFVCSRDPSHTHEVTATDIVINEDPATCLADGKTEYSVTIDFDGNTYSDTAVVTLPATGHNWGEPEWTWSGDYSEAEATFTCQNDPSHTETLNAVVTRLSSSATCTEPGNTEYKAELSFNGNVYTDSQSVSGEALGHNWDVSKWIWSDDYTSVTAKFVCSRDNSHTREISGQIKEDVIKPVSCTEDGESTFTATVSLDGEIYTDQKASVVFKAEGHVLSKNWSFDDVYHWYECTVCGEKRDISKHEIVDFICSVCNHTIIYTEGLEYTLSDDGASYLVSGIGTATDRDIKIMPRYNGRPVTGIADNAFKSNTEIDSVLIPDGVESIGANAFYGCGYLTKVVIPDSVKSIGGSAFYNCSKITRVDYSGDISGWLNIEGLDNLMRYVSSSCELYFSGTKVEGDIIIPEGVGSITGAFANLSAITSVTIPDSVTSIGEYAFYKCSSLTSVTIPDSVTSIGSYAFSGCSSLTSLTIPDSVTSIGEDAFEGCINLIQKVDGVGYVDKWVVDCDSSVTAANIRSDTVGIADSAFYDCTTLQSVTIPDSVKSIGGEAFSGCSRLTSVTIPDSVTSIGNYAFQHCSDLKSVIIGNGVTSIGNNAFRSCSSLTSVTIPDSVTSIGGRAFYHCSGLKSVTIGNGVTSIGEYTFYKCSGLTSVTIPDSVTSIGSAAFLGCSSLTEVTIPDSVTSIESAVFRDCRSLQSVTIGSGVTSIGHYAFYDCTSLSTLNWNAVNVSGFNLPNYVFYNAGTGGKGICVTFGDSVERIPNYLFYASNSNNPKIAGIEIGNNVKSIGYWAFSAFSSVSSVIIPASVESIGSYAFSSINTIYCEAQTKPTNWSSNWAGSSSNVIWGHNNEDSGEFSYVVRNNKIYITEYKGSGTEVTIPDTLGGYKVVSFGEIFKNSKNITKVVIGNNVTSVFPYAFYGCSGLQSVTIGNGVTSIGNYAFSGCSRLTSVTIPNSITSIGDYAFYGCSRLTPVTIPDSVTSIGHYVFYNCSSLTSITIPDSVTSIVWNAFSGCSGLKSVIIGNGVTSIGESAFKNFSSLQSVTIGNGVTSIGSYAFQNCSGLQSVTIGNGVTNIGEYAFFGCSSLTSVRIPDSVTSIGTYAFYYCSGLTSVTIPDSVTSIGDRAFQGCSGLQSVTIGNGVTSIGDHAFSGCSSLTSVTIPDSVTSIGSYAFEKCSGLTSVTIPDSVTTIGTSAFYNCSGLTSVTIPDSVTSIGEYAFSGCSGLQSVTIGNGVTSIGISAFDGCSSLTSATFKETSGWKAYRTSLSSVDLANKSTAAQYLTSTYVTYTWRRS